MTTDPCRSERSRRGRCSGLTYNPKFLIMSAQEFYRPGNSVPETGVYSAIHDSHRPVHEVILRKDDIFLRCANAARLFDSNL